MVRRLDSAKKANIDSPMKAYAGALRSGRRLYLEVSRKICDDVCLSKKMTHESSCCTGSDGGIGS